MVNQPNIVGVDKEQGKTIVVDVALSSDGNIRKKKQEKYQGLRVGTPYMEEWQQIPGKTTDISVQKKIVLRAAKYSIGPSRSQTSGTGLRRTYGRSGRGLRRTSGRGLTGSLAEVSAGPLVGLVEV